MRQIRDGGRCRWLSLGGSKLEAKCQSDPPFSFTLGLSLMLLLGTQGRVDRVAVQEEVPTVGVGGPVRYLALAWAAGHAGHTSEVPSVYQGPCRHVPALAHEEAARRWTGSWHLWRLGDCVDWTEKKAPVRRGTDTCPDLPCSRRTARRLRAARYPYAAIRPCKRFPTFFF